jgi:hypothetical protein
MQHMLFFVTQVCVRILLLSLNQSEQEAVLTWTMTLISQVGP